MRNLFVFLCVLTSCALATAQEEKEVFGKITDEYGPLENVVVSIEGSQKRAFSDEGGNYRIYAQEGDILLYELMGKLPMEIKVEDVTRVLNVTLRDKVEKLRGVTVTEKRRMKSQEQMSLEYASNPNIVKNSFGFLGQGTCRLLFKDIGRKGYWPPIHKFGNLIEWKICRN
ncbi:carboxypeptidase-like regulatory domain-containing protein [Maribacter litopenaei]|uniref:Carboxypeptidase-like regulatory domain-containing protein n=1 Tax=Maribacter litopenaei TaxID=2976127 RepID=A0ABY5YAS2_9FLAO|nr:carboxypeptidase-like regulatory domain-containing protein [Maribacter litopenaei]UWX56142.1 carboxypeptidase-like regulatory domain-containing protein [Maribacter litopenaei]